MLFLFHDAVYIVLDKLYYVYGAFIVNTLIYLEPQGCSKPDDFVKSNLDAGKTVIMRFIASEG